MALPDDDVVPVDAGRQWAPRPWNNQAGRVTLAGDAAHSMLPRKSMFSIRYTVFHCSSFPHSVHRSKVNVIFLPTDRGQGLNDAMKDAAEIVAAIEGAYAGNKSLKDAIHAYEAEMIPRGAEEERPTLRRRIGSDGVDASRGKSLIWSYGA